jgi:hypothetical protein
LEKVGAYGRSTNNFIVPIMRFWLALMTPATAASRLETAENGKL